MVSPENIGTSNIQLHRLYLHVYVYTYMHVMTFSERKGHAFEADQGVA